MTIYTLIENNLIGIDRERAIEHQIRDNTVITFNNLRFDGTLVNSNIQDSNNTAPEIVTLTREAIDDAVAFTFLTFN